VDQAKIELRRAHLDRGEDYEPPDVSLQEFLAAPEVAAAQLVGAFVSLGHEPSTFALRTALAGKLCLPTLEHDNSLSWRRDDVTLVPGLRGTLSATGESVPLEAIGVLVVPAVAVTAAGVRLGRGGGSYDRTIRDLRAARTDAWVVAWVSEGDVLAQLPEEEHDQRVDAIATEKGVRRAQIG
jgi:5-formyltetrahydrofolate cyclo-ligase